MEQTKKCTKCGVEKPFGDFNKAKLGKYGLKAICKECHREYGRGHHVVYYAENSQKRKEAQKIRRNSDPEKYRLLAKKYAAQHREERRDYMTKYRKEKASEIRIYQKTYGALIRLGRDRNITLAKLRERYHKATPAEREKRKQRAREYREKHKERIKVSKAEYCSSPAGRANDAKKRIARTFLKKACRLAETYAEEIKEIYRLANDTAELTGYEIHVDHICPLQAKIFDPDYGVTLPASGLHVPWNLNPVHYSTNLRKHNNVTLEEILA